MQFVDGLIGEIKQCVSIAFADDVDLMTDRINDLQQMQNILNACGKLCGAADRNIEVLKTAFFAKEQKQKQGQKVEMNLEEQLSINGTELNQKEMKVSAQMLGSQINSMLAQNK